MFSALSWQDIAIVVTVLNERVKTWINEQKSEYSRNSGLIASITIICAVEHWVWDCEFCRSRHTVVRLHICTVAYCCLQKAEFLSKREELGVKWPISGYAMFIADFASKNRDNYPCATDLICEGQSPTMIAAWLTFAWHCQSRPTDTLCSRLYNVPAVWIQRVWLINGVYTLRPVLQLVIKCKHCVRIKFIFPCCTQCRIMCTKKYFLLVKYTPILGGFSLLELLCPWIHCVMASILPSH